MLANTVSKIEFDVNHKKSFVLFFFFCHHFTDSKKKENETLRIQNKRKREK